MRNTYHNSPALVGFTAIFTAVPLSEALDAVQVVPACVVTYSVVSDAAYNTQHHTVHFICCNRSSGGYITNGCELQCVPQY